MIDVKVFINVEAEKIRKKIDGGNLYGDPIDMTDTNSLIVAAYLLGEKERAEEEEARMKFWRTP